MKVSKTKARYRIALGKRNCGNCRYMNKNGTCRKVEGQVGRYMVSDLWESHGTNT